jgi:hypothetical protein
MRVWSVGSLRAEAAAGGRETLIQPAWAVQLEWCLAQILSCPPPSCGRSYTSVRVPGRVVRRGRSAVERGRAARRARLEIERIKLPLHPGVPIATFRCAAPRVAARSPMSGASVPARKAAACTDSRAQVASLAAAVASCGARRSVALLRAGQAVLGSARWFWRTLRRSSGSRRIEVSVVRSGPRGWSPNGYRALHTGLLIATIRCAAPARCGAFADERGIMPGDAGGRVYRLACASLVASFATGVQE